MAKWDDSFINIIYEHIRDGGKIATFGKRIGVSHSTVKKWLAEKELFRDSAEEGKKALLERTQKSLLNRALGMTIPEIKVAYDKDLKEFVEHEIVKVLPPDPVSAIKILETLTESLREKSDDDAWSKSTTINHESKDGSMTPGSPLNMTPEQVKEAMEKLKDDF